MKTNFENKIRCNQCMNVFSEHEIIYDPETEKEYCPYCNESGYLMDLHNSDDLYDRIIAALPSKDESERGIFVNDDVIMCKTKEQAESISDLLEEMAYTVDIVCCKGKYLGLWAVYLTDDD